MWKLIALYFFSDTTELLSGWGILAIIVLASPSKKCCRNGKCQGHWFMGKFRSMCMFWRKMAINEKTFLRTFSWNVALVNSLCTKLILLFSSPSSPCSFIVEKKQKLTNLPGSSKSILGRLAVRKPNPIFSVLRSQTEITAVVAAEGVVGKHCSLVNQNFPHFLKAN